MSQLLIAGDVHGNTDHAKATIDKARLNGCHKVFFLGDFGAWEHFDSGIRYFDAVEEHARVRGMPVYFLDGNHDKTSLLLDKYGDQADDEGFLICRPHLRYAPRGHRWTWEGKKFIALGGAYSVDKDYRLALEQHEGRGPGRQWFPEEEMTDEEIDRILLTGLNAMGVPVDIMLTHDKPRASNPRWNRKDLPECWPNQDRIQRAVQVLKPDLLFHGHLHYRYKDIIEAGDGAFTEVVGLDADPWTAEERRGRRYNPEHSWKILDLGDWPSKEEEPDDRAA